MVGESGSWALSTNIGRYFGLRQGPRLIALVRELAPDAQGLRDREAPARRHRYCVPGQFFILLAARFQATPASLAQQLGSTPGHSVRVERNSLFEPPPRKKKIPSRRRE